MVAHALSLRPALLPALFLEMGREEAVHGLRCEQVVQHHCFQVQQDACSDATTATTARMDTSASAANVPSNNGTNNTSSRLTLPVHRLPDLLCHLLPCVDGQRVSAGGCDSTNTVSLGLLRPADVRSVLSVALLRDVPTQSPSTTACGGGTASRTGACMGLQVIVCAVR